MKRTKMRLAMGTGILLLALPVRAGDYDLKAELADNGLKSLTLPDGTAVASPFTPKIESVTFEMPDGTQQGTAPHSDKITPAFAREGNTVMLTNWPRARLSCTYETRGDTLLIRLALRNDGAEPIRSAHLRLLALRWPPDDVPLPYWSFNSYWTAPGDNPGNLHKNWWLYAAPDPEIGPPVVHARFPGYSIAYRLEDVAETHVITMAKPTPSIHLHGTVKPGETLEATVSLKFGPPEADPFAFNRDIFERYEAAWPMTLNWDDRGLYLPVFFNEQAGTALPYNPHGYGIVYMIHAGTVGQARQAGALDGYEGEPVITDEETLRRCFKGTSYYTPPGKKPAWFLPNLRSDAGKALFRFIALRHADQAIAELRKFGATGMIHWAIEGVENDGLHYNGDPRRVELRPEMMFKGRDGVATADAYFHKFRDAGFKVGNCLRPQITREAPPQEHATGFTVGAPGRIAKVRAYHTGHARMQGTHQARLWRRSDGKLLAGPVDLVMRADNPGWVEAAIPPVAVAPGEEYLASLGTDPGAIALLDATEFIAATEAALADETRSLRRVQMNAYYTLELGTMPTNTWEHWKQDSQDGNKWKPSPGMAIGLDVAFVPDGQEKELTLYGDAQSVKMQPRLDVRLEEMGDPDAIAEHMIAMIKYAQARWGSELFYIDSTVGGWNKETNTRTHPRNHVKGRTWELTPDIFQKVHEACPDVLLMPENQLMRHHAYSAPYNNYPGHGTARKIRSAWPGAFGLYTLYTHPSSNQEYWSKPESQEALIAAIRQGDIFLVRPHDPVFLEDIFQRAGRPPTARILAPAQGVTVKTRRTVQIEARAEDADGMIAKVEFFVSTIADGRRKIGEAAQAPYTVKWRPEQPGRYVLTIRAEDDAGLERWPGAVVVHAK